MTTAAAAVGADCAEATPVVVTGMAGTSAAAAADRVIMAPVRLAGGQQDAAAALAGRLGRAQQPSADAGELAALGSIAAELAAGPFVPESGPTAADSGFAGWVRHWSQDKEWFGTE